MSTMKKAAYSVEVIGFNQTERIVLSSIFGLSARRQPKFTQHSSVSFSPDLFLVDASDQQAMTHFNERNAMRRVPAIMIGESDHGTGFPLLARPLQWTRLFKAFDLAIANDGVEQRAFEKTQPNAIPVASLATASLATTSLSAVTTRSPVPVPAPESKPASEEIIKSSAAKNFVTAALAVFQPLSFLKTDKSQQVPSPIAPLPAAQTLPQPSPKPTAYSDLRTTISARVVTPVVVRPPVPPAAPPPIPVVPEIVAEAPDADWVLVVDDNLTVREFMRSKLAPFNFNVDYAESGEQAVGLTGHRRYTCVFLDVVMPGIDGYQVCKLIKSKKAQGKTHVVMLTSKGSPFDKIRGAMAGCDAYLTKPVDEEKLLETIVRFLPNRV
jgi:CheY-like chemotaxis protein